MDKITFTVEDWKKIKDSGVPVWFRVVGNSMLPFIRANRDSVMIVPAGPEELEVGDIVLFEGRFRSSAYCLHRLYRIDGDMVQTYGDGNRGPDPWIKKSEILGKAVLIERGKRTIDCASPVWIRRFECWNRLRGIRPFLLLPFRAANKLRRIRERLHKRTGAQETASRD